VLPLEMWEGAIICKFYRPGLYEGRDKSLDKAAPDADAVTFPLDISFD